ENYTVCVTVVKRGSNNSKQSLDKRDMPTGTIALCSAGRFLWAELFKIPGRGFYKTTALRRECLFSIQNCESRVAHLTPNDISRQRAGTHRAHPAYQTEPS